MKSASKFEPYESNREIKFILANPMKPTLTIRHAMEFTCKLTVTMSLGSFLFHMEQNTYLL